MADSTPPAAPFPVTSAHWALLVLATSLALSARLVAQRPVLPYGLKAGRHDAATRSLVMPGGALRAWYPAACGRPVPAPATPCADAPIDSGLFPLVLLAAPSGLVREDTVLALYLASHGYVVAAPDVGRAGPAPSLAAALASLDALGGVDSLRIAVVGRGPSVVAARETARGPRVGALVELDPPQGGSDAQAPAASQLPTLVLLRASAGVAPACGTHRVTIRVPHGAERRRLVPAMTHLFLSSALRGWGDPLPAMAERLRRLGL